MLKRDKISGEQRAKIVDYRNTSYALPSRNENCYEESLDEKLQQRMLIQKRIPAVSLLIKICVSLLQEKKFISKAITTPSHCELTNCDFRCCHLAPHLHNFSAFVCFSQRTTKLKKLFSLIRRKHYKKRVCSYKLQPSFHLPLNCHLFPTKNVRTVTYFLTEILNISPLGELCKLKLDFKHTPDKLRILQPYFSYTKQL